MSQGPSENLLRRVAARLGEPGSMAPESAESILTLSGAQYGSGAIQEDEVTRPTGFDPGAAALFEAIIESAFLVANADGQFDSTERDAFQRVVVSACNGRVAENQLRALLADLEDLFNEDGLDKRVAMVAKTITRPEQATEVLRIAGLIAHVSEGVSDVERGVLAKLAASFQLDAGAVDQALAEVEAALAD